MLISQGLMIEKRHCVYERTDLPHRWSRLLCMSALARQSHPVGLQTRPRPRGFLSLVLLRSGSSQVLPARSQMEIAPRFQRRHVLVVLDLSGRRKNIDCPASSSGSSTSNTLVRSSSRLVLLMFQPTPLFSCFTSPSPFRQQTTQPATQGLLRLRPIRQRRLDPGSSRFDSLQLVVDGPLSPEPAHLVGLRPLPRSFPCRLPQLQPRVILLFDVPSSWCLTLNHHVCVSSIVSWIHQSLLQLCIHIPSCSKLQFMRSSSFPFTATPSVCAPVYWRVECALGLCQRPAFQLHMLQYSQIWPLPTVVGDMGKPTVSAEVPWQPLRLQLWSNETLPS